MEARVFAEQRSIRLIGLDRPGIGSSTPFQYENVLAFAADMATIADTLGIDRMAVVGLSGGGPYTLACAAAMPDRIVAAGVLGGVAPTVGPDAIGGGLMALGTVVGSRSSRWPADRSGIAASTLIRLIRPVAEPAVYLYAAISPEADRKMLVRPEFKAMFLDDLLNGSRKQLAAPFADIVVFATGLGFPPRRGQGAGPVVARRPRPHRAVRPWSACGQRAARRRALPPAGREPPRRTRPLPRTF